MFEVNLQNKRIQFVSQREGFILIHFCCSLTFHLYLQDVHNHHMELDDCFLLINQTVKEKFLLNTFLIC